MNERLEQTISKEASYSFDGCEACGEMGRGIARKGMMVDKTKDRFSNLPSILFSFSFRISSGSLPSLSTPNIQIYKCTSKPAEH